MLAAVTAIVATLSIADSQLPDGLARDTEVAAAYAALSGATFTGAVKGVTPTADADFTRKDYVDDADALKAALAGATFTGATAGLDPTDAQEFVTRAYLEANSSTAGFTLREGAGAPADALGDDGDWYIDTTGGGFYEKESGSWVLRYTDQAGGGGTVSVVAYSAPLTNIAATTYATATQILDLGTETINLGAFTVDATGTRDRLVIPEDGVYDLRASVHVTSAQRIIAVVQFTLDNGVDPEAAIAGQGTGYSRGLDDELFIVAEHSHYVELSAGDKIGVTLVGSNDDDNMVIVGASSSFEAVRVGGAKGDAGPAGGLTTDEVNALIAGASIWTARFPMGSLVTPSWRPTRPWRCDLHRA